ncbi:MAG: TrbC/VirB2 family protein [Clostridia bacterium]|nr:TrbC/VirB2 family protein [Clostridia bacterium]
MKKQKILFMFLLFLIIILINVSSFAAVDENFFENHPITSSNDTDSIFKAGDGIISLLQLVGVGIAVVSTLVLGIKYMYSSPNEKADIKSKLIPWITGGILIFGATTIVKIIESVVA